MMIPLQVEFYSSDDTPCEFVLTGTDDLHQYL